MTHSLSGWWQSEREFIFNFMVFHSEDPLITLAEEEMESIQIFFFEFAKVISVLLWRIFLP